MRKDIGKLNPGDIGSLRTQLKILAGQGSLMVLVIEHERTTFVDTLISLF